MSISKSQLDALNRGLLDKFGKASNDPTLNEGGLMGEILQNVAQRLIEELRKDIEEKKLTGTRNLTQSIDSSRAVEVADGVSVTIDMNKYWPYVEDGRGKGNRPPIASIEEWISAKGIQVRQSAKESTQSVLERRRSLAYAIASKIAKRGTIKRFGYKGGNFIKDVLTPDNIDIIAQHLSEMAGKKIELYVSVE